MLRALIFDVDGTLADTEATHRDAFNKAFAAAGLSWHWDVPVYTRLLDVAGGSERILHYWLSVDPRAASEPDARGAVARLHAAKTRVYECLAGDGRLELRPGVLRLILEASGQGMPMAIATTTTPANVDALLRGPLGAGWRSYFKAIGDGSTAGRKKPHPQVYLQVLATLGLPGSDCLAFEDSHNGLQAARAAGVPAIVTPTAFTSGHDFSDALLVLPDLGGTHGAGDQESGMPPGSGIHPGVDLDALRRWHAGMSLSAA